MSEEIDSDEYDSDGSMKMGCKKCCAVELPDDFDPNKIPTTGEEYLQYVMYEAQNHKAISTDTELKKKVDELATKNEEPTYVIPESPKVLLPTREWSKQKFAEFTKFRKYIQTKLPPPHLRNTANITWMKNLHESYPKFSVVSKFDLGMLSHLTEELAEKLSNIKHGGTIPEVISVWIYTILALVEVPLLAEDVANVRCIAKRCTEIRSLLPPDAPSEMYNNLNFFICIIGLYFKQDDLVNYADA